MKDWPPPVAVAGIKKRLLYGDALGVEVEGDDLHIPPINAIRHEQLVMGGRAKPPGGHINKVHAGVILLPFGEGRDKKSIEIQRKRQTLGDPYV